MAHRDIAESFLKLAARGRAREAGERYVAPSFRHHNPYFEGTAEALLSAIDEDARKHPDKQLDIRLALEDGDRVAVMSHVRQKPDDRGAAVVHVFRFEGERIVELWDVGQDVPQESVNEHGMF
jgi:predicted SnoaL-like aldol condensation-catalyzing enzyme